MLLPKLRPNVVLEKEITRRRTPRRVGILLFDRATALARGRVGQIGVLALATAFGRREHVECTVDGGVGAIDEVRVDGELAVGKRRRFEELGEAFGLTRARAKVFRERVKAGGELNDFFLRKAHTGATTRGLVT